MICYYSHDTKKCLTASEVNDGILSKVQGAWIDLCTPTDAEIQAIEHVYSIELSSFRIPKKGCDYSFSEGINGLEACLNVLKAQDLAISKNSLAVIIPKGGGIITAHERALSILDSVAERLSQMPISNDFGLQVAREIFENIINDDGELVEKLTERLSSLSDSVVKSAKIDKSILVTINDEHEHTVRIRENLFSIQCVLSALIRSNIAQQPCLLPFESLIKYIDAIISQIDINFQRLDYLQDAALGLINIEQNNTIKILSVAAVIFMPPTLVASIYGMNFKVMPELDWIERTQGGWIIPAGYIFSIILMFAFAFLTYWFFRRKKWL